MSLLEDIAAEELSPGYRCGVATLLDTLAPPDAADLRTAIDARYTNAQIARAVTKRGHKLEAFTISRHRRGECRCGK